MSEKITIEEKFDLFKLILSREIKEERLKQKKIQSETRKQESIEKKEQIRKGLEKIEQKYDRLKSRNIPKLINSAKTKARNMFLVKENEVEETFFEELKEAFPEKEFSEYYKLYLKNAIEFLKDITTDRVLIIYIREKDRALFADLAEEIFSDFEISFRELAPEYIAGFIARDRTEHVSFDFSISNLIQENREYIAKAFSERMNEPADE